MNISQKIKKSEKEWKKSLTEEAIEEFQKRRVPQRRINYWTSDNS